VRLLHLTMELPYAPGGPGGATRQFQLLRRLVELGHEVTVVSAANEAHERETGAVPVMRAAGFDYQPARRAPSRAVELAQAARHDPRAVARVATRPWFAWQFGVFWANARAHALQLVEELRPDAITVEHDDLAAVVRDLPGAVPAVLCTQNASWRLLSGRAGLEGGLRRIGLKLEAGRHRRMTARAVPLYAGVVAVSEADARDFLELGAGRVEQVPNGADFGRGPLAAAGGPPTLLFTGSMDHSPNRDAALWFGREVWPLVAERVPEARLAVVGRGPQEQLRSLAAQPGVEVAGAVPSIEPYFERAHVAIAPLRSGGGSRLKILEALAAGRPVLSTTVGAEGLDLEPGRDLLIADGAEAFAEAAVGLLGDRELRERLASDGRSAAAARYDWPALGDCFAVALESIAGTGS
jgi:glycosyltransferase involved in cell wall biosynthesis